jgi:AmmeMemoRadiSam system protein B/AmmeMemoRadiSam system protein A
MYGTFGAYKLVYELFRIKLFMKKYYYQFLLFFLLVCYSCSSQDNSENLYQQQLHNLKPAFAGQFYPANKTELEQNLKVLFSEAEPQKVNNVLAVISPHAGYIFSGMVAASGFNQLDPEKQYENIFLIASSHRAYYEGASIYSVGNCETPLGEIKVNIILARKLIDENDFFSFKPDAHISEHSIEVQLPFLQYKLMQDFQIIPIVIGTQSKKVCEKIAEALKPYFNEKNLFIISSDFSHYPEYNVANKWDNITSNAILANDPDLFFKTINDESDDKIRNLDTRACGWSSLLTLLYMTQKNPDVEFTHILYKNSGDTEYGDKDRVVGYNSIVISKKGKCNPVDQFHLNNQDKEDLLEIARNTIEVYISGNKIPVLFPQNYSESLKTKCGAFVTLKKNHELRGCIGKFDAEHPLYEVVQQMAIASSTKDSRFLPVTKNELKDIEIEISVLTPMQKIKSVDEIVLGRHGIYIKKGYLSGTFLPQVAIETGWNLEEFLGHCSRDKAGLGWDGWKEADVYIYEAQVFGENDF